MTPKDIRTAISKQCGFNKAKHRQDLRVKLSPERLEQLKSICQRHPVKQGKTQPQRLLESIIPKDSLETDPVADNATTETGDTRFCHLCEMNVYLTRWDHHKTWCNEDNAFHYVRKQLRERNKGHIVPNQKMKPYKPTGRPISVSQFIREWDACHKQDYKATQVCNAGDWPTVEDQQRYWQERDKHLDRIESNALWFDNKEKTEIPF